MRRKLSYLILLIFLVTILSSSGCSSSSGTLVVLSGSENEALEPIIQKFEKQSGIKVEMKYKGSVDIMLELENSTTDFDAVWPANSLWVSIGDKKRVVKHLKSIMTSPVVFGIRKSLAGELGFIGTDVSVKDILNAITAKKLSFMMTSATQSNSGASAYIGFLYALLDNTENITKEDLRKPELKLQLQKLFSGINRSSASSGWLKDLFLQGSYDAMVNYESIIIETNKELIKKGKEPLYVVYPHDGLVLSDSPLGYVNRGDAKKQEMFKRLQEYLLSEKVQEEISALGRRTGLGGIISKTDPNVFNPDWGIDSKKLLSPIKLPSPDVIEEALNLYQTAFKKPSYAIYCLDFSGSMSGEGEKKLKEAMTMILNQDIAKKYLLHSSAEDVVAVIPFSDKIFDIWEVRGNDPQQFKELLERINSLSPQGATDIYSPVIEALSKLDAQNLDNYIPSIVLMTDGKSNTGKSFYNLKASWSGINKDIPVFSIMFGSADAKQLEEIASLTRARVFDGKHNLVDAFKKARGYN
ncbi:MAG: VWA domain-containing protein [Clostridia bacterium]|nr:VWA domain-containing protein [Clostridia bacterium]